MNEATFLCILANGWGDTPSWRCWLFGLGVMGFATALPLLRTLYGKKIQQAKNNLQVNISQTLKVLMAKLTGGLNFSNKLKLFDVLNSCV